MTVLSRRALNRAYLARQLLLERSSIPVLDAVEHLAGLQAQAPLAPYTGLFSRLTDFDPGQLALLMNRRQVVRMTLIRGTVHLVSTRDGYGMLPLFAPLREKGVMVNPQRRAAIVGIDLDELRQAGLDALGANDASKVELAQRLAERWPNRNSTELAAAALMLLPLVQTTPRGVWGSSGNPRWQTLSSWTAGAAPAYSTGELVLRYLRAYGPATVMDAQTWSGLTRLASVFERLREQLVSFRAESGHELFDLPDAPRPDSDIEAPVRLVAEFDNLTLSHADRSRVISAEDRRRISARNGMVPGMLLVDGMVRGQWRIERQRKKAILQIQPFAALGRGVRPAVRAEGERLLSFTDPGCADRRVQFLPR